MKRIIGVLWIVVSWQHLIGQCAVNTPSGDYEVVSKSTIQYDNYVNSIFRRIKNIYGLDCEYFYYDDSQSNNANANRDDGNVYLGVNLLNRSFRSGTGLTGIYFVIAHEMSHLWQFNHNDQWLEDVDGTVKYSELQADFMAGYVLARLGYINNYNYRQLLSQVWDMGDDEWHEQGTHGTPTERVMDAHLGLTHASESVSMAYRASLGVAPEKPGEMGKVVAEIDFNDRSVLYIVYGGAVYDANNNRVGQMTGIPNTYNWRINFSKEGWGDLIISGSNHYVYNLNNIPVGVFRNLNN